ncbi:MAG: RNA polymerase sigma factor [Bacteroidetes bacterium]|nr:RNA polymerase sigma factor [Bacteroidota bacterium]
MKLNQNIEKESNKASLTIKTDDNVLINEYIKNKSELAAKCIVNKYRQDVFKYVVNYVKDIDDAYDISQDIFIKILSKIEQFEQRSSFKTWIFAITRNTCLTFLKSKNNNTNIFSDVDIEDLNSKYQLPDNSLETKELNVALAKAIKSLPKKQRESFFMHYILKLKHHEIADITSTSEGTVKANCFQAIAKLRKKLSNYV